MVGMDKLGKPTGPGDGGFMVTDQDVPSNVVFEFILSNYNIDGNVLKPEHKKLLDEHIIPFLKANGVHAELTGTASRTGAANYNRELSRERVLRVRQYLLMKGLSGAQVPASDMRAVGEDKSTSKFDEDELERSVRIRIVVGVRPVQVLPKIIIPQIITPKGPILPNPVQVLEDVIIEVDTRVPWQIQQLSGFNNNVSFGGGVGVGVSVSAGVVEYHFLLVNGRTRQMSQCRYIGAAVGAGLGPMTSFKPSFGPGGGLSMTQGSHTWDGFKTRVGTQFDDFSGSATWTEPAGLGGGSDISVKAILTFHRLGVTARVSTGHTIGTPGSLTSFGNFHLKPPVQLQL